MNENLITWTLRSLEASHFDSALNQNEMDLETIGKLPSPRVMVTRVTVWADQNLDWDIMFFLSSNSQPNADPDLDTMLDWVSFVAADGVQIAGAGLFRYAVTGLRLIYESVDQRAHLGLINRAATAKNAGATGNVVIELGGYLI